MAALQPYSAHTRAILTLGLPLIGSHIAQMTIHMTDTLMMGWYGVDELAALTLAGSVYIVIFLFGSGFAFAVMPIVAQAVGSGDETRVRRATRMGMWASLIFFVLAAPILWASESLLLAIGQDPQISELAQDYLRIAVIGFAPALMVMVIKSYLAALERTQIVLWITVAAFFANVALNYAFVFGNWGAPEMGVRGAAIASITVQLLTFPALAIYAVVVLPEHTLFKNFWRADPEALREVFRLGWPIALTNLAEVGLFVAAAIMMGWVGTQDLAAHGIAIQWASIMFMVHLGLSNVATIRAGNAQGRNDPPNLRRGALVVTLISLVFALLVTLLFVAVPAQLISVFLDPTIPNRTEIIEIGAGLLIMAGLFQFADSAQVITLGLLRGVHDMRTPMIFAVVSYCIVGLPSSYILGFTFDLGGIGVWAGLVIGLAVAAILLAHRFWTGAGRAH